MTPCTVQGMRRGTSGYSSLNRRRQRILKLRLVRGPLSVGPTRERTTAELRSKISYFLTSDSGGVWGFGTSLKQPWPTRIPLWALQKVGTLSRPREARSRVKEKMKGQSVRTHTAHRKPGRLPQLSAPQETVLQRKGPFL